MQFTIEKERREVRILVIEDEDCSRECICDFLELVGFSTVQARNGREGVEMFGRHAPDAVITDIIMPEMNGIDLLKFMQSNSPETPVIVISGTDSLDDVAQCIKLGAWDYIIKPVYDYGIVEMSVLRVLEKRQLTEENKRYREYLEDEVIKRSDELLRDSLRFKTLFNLASDVMLINDQDGRIIDCNEMAVKHIGYRREQLLGMNMRDLIAEEDADLFARILAKLPLRNNIMYETRFKHQSGSVVIMEQHVSMIAAGDAPLMLVMCRDVTERRRIEQEREELRKKIVAAQKMELAGLLAGGIAHDFNNVLTALTGYASLLQMKAAEIGGEAEEYTNMILDIAGKGQALAGRLMSFIRKRRDELVPVDIHKALRDTETLLRPNSKSIKITLDFGAGKFEVLGDESQIQNAFLNLGLNARDAMPNGGELIFRTRNADDFHGLGSKSGGGFIRIDVVDTGVGIDEAHIKKIFDPLFTTKVAGEGTGLGLPGVLSCVKNMHGHIDVESIVGKGSEFKIILPLHSADAGQEIDLTGKSVLVVTGVQETADLICGRLECDGLSAECFEDAVTMLGWLKKNSGKVGAIVVDCELLLFDEISFADGVSELAPGTLIIKMLGKDRISLGSNKDYAAFVNMPIESDRFFESVTMYIRDIIMGAQA